MSSLKDPKDLKIPKNYNFILERARSMPKPLRVAIAGADSENILAGAMAAQEEGFVEPILIGNYKKIKTTMETLGISEKNCDLQPISGDTNAVQYAIEMIRSGNADCLMRGNTQTRDFLMPVLNKANHLIQEDRLLTHVVTACQAVHRQPQAGDPQHCRRTGTVWNKEAQDRPAVSY